MTYTDRGSQTNSLIVRLADEGVPISAIARAASCPAEQVRNTVKAALAAGTLVEMPAEDWPTNTRRDARSPTLPAVKVADLDTIAVAIQVTLGTRPTLSRFLAILIMRGEAARPTILAAVQLHSRPDACPKIVDVYAMQIRQVLARHGLTLETVWGRGYALTQAVRQRLVDMIAETNSVAVRNAA